jgi:predicted MFS family arabinose efflux permease
MGRTASEPAANPPPHSGPADARPVDAGPVDASPVDASTGSGPGISRRLVLLLAAACGAAVANNYYAQPLLHTIATAFGVSEGTAGLLVTAGQAGYAVGLALLVPLGDILHRRRLITLLLVLTAAAQALAAAAPGFAVLASALAIAGVTSVVAQIIVPMAASLAGDDERGRVVGTVMSGLLIGILMARTISGLVASISGWRTVFVMAAVIMLLLAAILWRALPDVGSRETISYGGLLASVLTLVREEPVLRLRMGYGAVAMGCVSILWTPIAFLLSGPPYHYGNAIIGLFGLAGVAGVIAAPMAGRLADRGHARFVTLGAIGLLIASWGLVALGISSIPALVAGIVVLDFAAQALHISNQDAIYALRPAARSRVNTAYMVAYFLSAAAMSAASSAVFGAAGWKGVCALGAVTAASALVLWLLARKWDEAHPEPGAATAGAGTAGAGTAGRGSAGADTPGPGRRRRPGSSETGRR